MKNINDHVFMRHPFSSKNIKRGENRNNINWSYLLMFTLLISKIKVFKKIFLINFFNQPFF